MKAVPAALALAALLSLASAPAHARCCDDGFCSMSTYPAHWGPRHDPRDAQLAIDTEDRDVSLLLTREVVAFQLSDRTMRKVWAKLRAEENEDDNPLAKAIKLAVFSGVRSMLDHSAEYPIRRLRDVEYANGRLEFVTNHGRHVFRHLDVHDRDVCEAFSERDARAFVAAFHRIKSQQMD